MAATAATPTQQVIIALLAGQSNMEGRNRIAGAPEPAGATEDPNPELYVDMAGVYQFGGSNSAGDNPDSAGAYYRILTTDLRPMEHPGNNRRIGPDLPILYKIKADNPSAIVVGVPLAVGSSALVGSSWGSSATPGAGGTHFERMITHGNLARDAVLAAWPGAAITFRFFWIQGEQDAGTAQTYAAYYAGLGDVIDRARARITGAAGALWTLGSMLPNKWAQPGDPEYNVAGYSTGYADINRAHVMISLDKAGVKYQRAPNSSTDNLHVQPHAAVRTFGTAMANAINDAAGPSVTTNAAQGGFTNAALDVPLTHDNADYHATFAITGGADAAQFEISDPYIDPTLRWVGNGNGPVAGNYVVQVSARDGAGNVGPAKAITVTQAAPAVQTLAVTNTYTRPTTITGAFGTFTAAAVPIHVGRNWIFFSNGGGGYKTGLAMTVGGVAATKVYDPGTGNCTCLFWFDSAIETTSDVVVTHSGSAMSTIYFGSFTTVGHAAVHDAVGGETWTNTGDYLTQSLTCSAGGKVIGAVMTNGAVTAMAPTQHAIGGPSNQIGIGSRTTTGSVTATASGAYRATIAVALAQQT